MKKFSKQNLTPTELETLSIFLEANSDISLAGLHGFLTSIGSSPLVINPSEWLEGIFNKEFDSIEKAQEIMELVFRMYNQILRELQEECFLPLLSFDNHDAWAKNVDRKALSNWCTQYLTGTTFYEDVMDNLLRHGTEDDTKAINVSLFTLMLFADIDNQMVKDSKNNIDHMSIEEIEKDREKILPMFPKVIQAFYSYWRDFEEMMEKADEDLSNHKIGRNDPCFCGSGKKYKKCCLH